MTNPFSKPKTPPPPAPPKPIPLPDDAQIQRSERRAAADRQRRSGRASTVLSQGDKLEWWLLMEDSRAKELIKQGDYLFTKKSPLLSLHQEQADHFYPERADFTFSRSLGVEFANHLTTSFPVLTRRELGSTISAMLRPNNKEWYNISIAREERLDNSGRAWLEDKEKVMRRAMYDRQALFVRATKEADNDFVTFGNAVLSTELNRSRDALIYRCWHLRDVVWKENYMGVVDTVHRKWKPTARELVQTFGVDRLDGKIVECTTDSNKNPYKQFNVRHIVLPVEQYQSMSGEGVKFNTPYVSIYVDVDHMKVIEETGAWTCIYSVPRWQTVAGSQYGYSPATVAALPDARLIQAMTLTLLEAGEKAVNPPMIAQGDVVRSDISIFAGGVTWVDKEYDERLGESIKPINQDYGALPFGMDMREDVKSTIMEAFYLNKLSLPPIEGGDMTAYEVGQRIEEYIRNALPLFEPMEMEYNGSVCEHTFEILMREGAFGSPADMPDSLRGQEIKFKFKSPLHDAVDRQHAQKYMETKNLLAQAVEMDPDAPYMVDGATALRETLKAIGTPAAWLREESEVKAMSDQRKQQMAQAQQMEMLDKGGKGAANAAKAAKELSQMQQ